MKKATVTLRQGTARAKAAPRRPWREVFSIDPRSLAAFRIAVAVLLLADLAIRFSDLGAMYTDDGMFSRAEICRRATTIWNWSFHFGSGSWGYQAGLFGTAAALALALLVGFQTRLATIGSWLMLISLHHRVPPILSGAEILLRSLLFWAMFLPLARAWSLDGWLARRRGEADSSEAPVCSVASGVLLLQMVLMYLFSALAKTNPAWLSGEAIALSMQHDFFGSPAGAYLLQFPGLLKAMTWGSLALEWGGPLLLLSSIGYPRLRLVVIALLALMHLGIIVCFEVGFFSYVSMAGLMLFLPAEFWRSRWMTRCLGQGQDGPTRGVPAAAVRPETVRSRIAQGACLLLFLFVVAVNINNHPSRPLATLSPEQWRPLTRGLGLSQNWSMFAAPPSKDGWYVAKAKLRDGSDVDLLRDGAPVDWKRPEFPGRLYPNHFWRKLFREMAYDDEQGFQLMRAPVGSYLCRRWNLDQPTEKQIVWFELVFCSLRSGEPEPSTSSRAPRLFRELLLHLDFPDLVAGHSLNGDRSF